MDHQPWGFLNLVFCLEAKMFLQTEVPARIRQFLGKSKEAEKQEFEGLGRGIGSWSHWSLGVCAYWLWLHRVAGIALLDFPCSQWKLETWRAGHHIKAIGRTDTEAETPILWPPHAKSWLTGKDPDAGKDWGQEEKGTTEDEMAGWHHRLNGHEFE